MATKRKTGKKKTRKSTKTRVKHRFFSLCSAFLAGVFVTAMFWLIITWHKMPLLSNEHYITPSFNFRNTELNVGSPPSHPISVSRSSQNAEEITHKTSSSLPIKPEHEYLVYLNSYANFHRADNERAYLILRGFDAKVSKSSLLNAYLLWIGPFPSLEIAYRTQTQLKSEYRQSRVTTQ